MTKASAGELCRVLNQGRIGCWIVGGAAADALLGRCTRPHKDFDVPLVLSLRHLETLPRVPFEHGTRNGNAWYRCRCDECRVAWAAYQRGVRAARAQAVAGRADLPHGTISTYRNHGCRCPRCAEAQREANRGRASRAASQP